MGQVVQQSTLRLQNICFEVLTLHIIKFLRAMRFSLLLHLCQTPELEAVGTILMVFSMKSCGLDSNPTTVRQQAGTLK